MAKSFQIGEIAKIFNIPQSTLRYYDQIGLFRPNHSDPESHYRYYTTEQFVLLDTILFLRKLGIPVGHIQKHMATRSLENTRMLFQKQLEKVKSEIHTLESAAKKLEQKIATMTVGQQLYRDQTMKVQMFPKRPISLIYIDPLLDIWDSLDLYIRELGKTLPPNHQGFFSGDIGMLLKKESLIEDKIDQSVYSGVFYLYDYEDENISTDTYLPEGDYACMTHTGSYDSMIPTYKELLRQIRSNGYVVNGDAIELALIDEMTVQNSDDFVTVIQVPVQIKP
ncbi:DNA-binding transcriptional MerR regulator/effector-binding domain-containing protein [Pullulanibacillus pueri]|uniref:MerR family transcriptional regulator n=1 Tax=Pullulanibacillus pueri TaxID=1437324 RepID=A0A8J2ZSN8_9BACL|nr:MerR family transcriptional regulator [Pullulanibacillus pueri]MBM7681801.1 DNA-binding transcriptional MerR regulator/effector-binding domain-containing protein [Pullulanibacillus pueri]GGH76140.1 MerR family transcriptional regulator [Pullulanibacillus pueri]